VCGLQGSGVFSTVLRVRELLPGTNGAPSTEGRELVVKLIRSNETMYKAGQKELEYLKLLAANDPDNKKHVVHLLANFMHRNHLCLVFEPLNMDLRKVSQEQIGARGSSLPSTSATMCSLTQRHVQLTFHVPLIHSFTNSLQLVCMSIRLSPCVHAVEVIKKFGSVGLSLSAVRSYAKQLCIALRHLKKCMILHGDIKPVQIHTRAQI